METKKCFIEITMHDRLDFYHEEDIVKQIWPYMVPFMTRRHGVDKGLISLNDGNITISWEYKDIYPEDYI